MKDSTTNNMYMRIYDLIFLTGQDFKKIKHLQVKGLISNEIKEWYILVSSIEHDHLNVDITIN